MIESTQDNQSFRKIVDPGRNMYVVQIVGPRIVVQVEAKCGVRLPVGETVVQIDSGMGNHVMGKTFVSV